MTSDSNTIELKTDEPQTLRILLLSDIHENAENVKLVRKYIQDNDIKIDELWVPGDFLNMKAGDNEEETSLKTGEKSLKELLQLISTIHPNPIFIPGNHDPITLFDDKLSMFGDCIHVHQQIHRIRDNLYIAGFGGSVPAFRDNVKRWDGYPFTTEQAFEEQYKILIEKMKHMLNTDVKNNEKKSDVQFVLFTHNGPSESSTTYDWRDNSLQFRINTGSVSIFNSLLDEEIQSNIVCNIHGHTHAGVGQAWIGKTRILNPGALLLGKFAILELEHSNSWQVKSMDFKELSTKQI